ncbi:hypothetical protein JWG45_16000 [Leptospira sp. 201903070]|uniref:MarR family transcriptional regulator n=1 Tax=Leptospira ainlahdjerensis TaxID=2810033 RepID=A0ABS2UER7_9LEPT|nr:hypothetical protein [Leptospira ainlahdjerensis]MBM9578649.1 hypothetical protein [Leptospira ainlahdjerensis]
MKYNDEQIIEKLNSLTENDMIEKIIIPIYKVKFKNRFYDIENTGKNKQEDQGIDITYYEISEDTKTRVYSGIQVKQDDINTGSGANGISAIIIQANQAFLKKIADTTNKNTFYIKTFKILTTKNILPKARMQIVDQLKDKNIEFITGKDLIKWIRESFEREFLNIFPEVSDISEENDEKITPIGAVLEYIENNFKDEIDDLKSSFKPLDGESKKIIFSIILHKNINPYQIGKQISSSKQSVIESIDNLRSDGLVDYDDEGEIFIATSDFDELEPLNKEIEDRIKLLGYTKELDSEEVLEKLLIRSRY